MKVVFVQAIEHECLDQFVVFGERHPEYLIREYEDHSNTERPHQGIGNRTIGLTALFRFGDANGSRFTLNPSLLECPGELGVAVLQEIR